MTTSSSSLTSHDFRFSRFLKSDKTDLRRVFGFDPIGAIDTVELTDVIDEFKSTSLIVDESKFYRLEKGSIGQSVIGHEKLRKIQNPLSVCLSILKMPKDPVKMCLRNFDTFRKVA